MDDLDRMHREFMEDPEYRKAHAEEDLITRAAIHVLRRRRELGLTQQELADKVGKRRAWIARVEGGYENLTLRTVGQLAYALESDPMDLLRPIEEPSPRSRPRKSSTARV